MDSFKYLLQTKELYTLAETLCQDNHLKREITDVAISKIPYVVYPDLDVNQSLIIHEFAEYSLRKSKEENNHNEVAITYDLDNGLLLKDGFAPIIEHAGICYGKVDETDLFADTQTMSTMYRAKNTAVVNLHNHPSCFSFSVQDISFFLTQASIKLMVVVCNSGELYYLSKNLEQYQFKDAMDYFINIVNTVHFNAPINYKWQISELRTIADLFLKNCRTLGIDYKHVLGTDIKLKNEIKNEERDYER